MKIIAYYLPQFHEIPENNEWWGKGFTEWVNVKKSQPLFDGHYQPHIPLNNNYYNLLDDDVKEWQINLAKQYGIYGFCFYHYWFDGHLLLEKPVEQYLANSELNHPFCISWANEHWTKAWASKENQVLIAQKYGGPEEWKKHFEYLLPYFKDKRYILNNGKPLFIIYRPDIIHCLNDMLDLWKQLAKEAGFQGLDIAYNIGYANFQKKIDDSRSTYNVYFQPSYAFAKYPLDELGIYERSIRIFKKNIYHYIFNKFKISLSNPFKRKNKGPHFIDYDKSWEYILKCRPISEKDIPGAYVGWDNTPRRGENGTYTVYTPEKFGHYLKRQIIHTRDEYKTDMLFMFAWNEWAEGGYLEPDEKYGLGYLEAVRNALIETDEFPVWNE